MNIYIDIDGVLIDDTLENHGALTSHAVEFLREVTTNHNCYWLTTHCFNGENHVMEYLSKKFPVEAHEYLRMIKPTNWKQWKTEAIDFTQNFRWIDDESYEPELAILKKHNCIEKLIVINLSKNPDQLAEMNLIS